MKLRKYGIINYGHQTLTVTPESHHIITKSMANTAHLDFETLENGNIRIYADNEDLTDLQILLKRAYKKNKQTA